jgi:hypothetical protein
MRPTDRTAPDAAALEAQADALWWSSRIDESIGLRQRAYLAYVAAGDLQRACFNAWFLSVDHALKGEPAASSGWLMRAKDDLPADTDCRERALLAVSDADRANGSGRTDRSASAGSGHRGAGDGVPGAHPDCGRPP